MSHKPLDRRQRLPSTDDDFDVSNVNVVDCMLLRCMGMFLILCLCLPFKQLQYLQVTEEPQEHVHALQQHAV